ncbi:MAG: GGDEF domain-containing protein [Ruminococcus sp.]|nr:GGDEF domain-containing protein [Ruminococcus sp.]
MLDDAVDIFRNDIDAILLADAKANTIRPLVKRGVFSDFIEDSWKYTDLIEKLWYHFNNSAEDIDKDYHVFLPTSGKFVGKYSRRINLMVNDIIHVIQMMIYPVGDEQYMILLDELDKSMFRDEDMTNKKVDTIQNIYLFSMYIDIVKDTTSSIRVTEISGDVINQQLKYTQWRMMIVNMISPEFQTLFLNETDPENLKRKYAPGQSSSFDCLMKNLEGEFIWVKLIFSRAETSNDNDFRFVFMVQNIHESFVSLHQTLKKYEQMASMDSLTSIFNHGRIETEMCNAIEKRSQSDRDISIMMLDIDFFKNINDKYGHSVGDDTLVHFTQTAADMIKDKNAVIGRWGGEEFVIVCYDTSIEQARELAEKIRCTIADKEFDKISRITCSIGITEITDNDKFDTAFERMDNALYNAKSNGRNCVKVG